MSDSDVFQDRHLYEDEEVIEKAINYLKYKDPVNANREYAVGYLKFMQRFAFTAEKTEGFDFDKFFDKYQQSESDNKES